MGAVSANSSSSTKGAIVSFQPQYAEEMSSQEGDDAQLRTHRVMEGSPISSMRALQTPLPMTAKVITAVPAIDARILSFSPFTKIGETLSISRAAQALQKNLFQHHLQQLTVIKACDIPRYQKGLGLPSDNWADVLRHCSNVRHLDCETYQKQEDLLLLPLFIRLLPHLTSISFHKLIILNMKELLDAFPTARPNLQSVDFYGVELTDEIVKECAPMWPGLNHIDISCNPHNPSVKLQYLAEFCPHIRSLALQFCGTLRDSNLEAISSLFPKLEHLDIEGNFLVSDIGIRFIADRCRSLQSIKLKRNHDITDVALQALATTCTSLRHIDLTHCNKIEDVGVRYLAENCDLLSLELTGCKNLTSLQSVAAHCPNLTYLSIGSCRSISYSEIWNLMKKCSKLNYIYLKKCKQLSKKEITSLKVAFPKCRIVN